VHATSAWLLLLPTAGYGAVVQTSADPRQPAASVVDCPVGEAGEIVVCKRAGEISPQRLRPLGAPPGIGTGNPTRIDLPSGATIQGGGPPNTAGITLKIPF
jgi:hypothetical protein